MGRFEERITAANARTEELADSVGNALVNGFHLLALFAIGGAIVWSAAFAFAEMVEAGTASVEDILLLFIYLELGAMVGIYFKTNHMPVRFLIYVAITALTRFLIGFVNEVHKPDEGILVIVGGILLLGLAALALRYGSYKFPSSRSEADSGDAATPSKA
ncbi:MAG: phosphate-starvation-inducible PsiE family protein [Alphaproteobacteria bacterium]|jgi:phosphate starvation-inducible membrane PsiE|nr:phosphate-starvation-inducible PsiE family protein [Alphaproteobacteria bacterium]